MKDMTNKMTDIVQAAVTKCKTAQKSKTYNNSRKYSSLSLP